MSWAKQSAEREAARGALCEEAFQLMPNPPCETYYSVSKFKSRLILHVSQYALESPIPPADLAALSPGYQVPPDLATIPYAPWHMRFVLLEATTSD